MKNQNGITLIALIITIIVMLILVGVTANVALNGGLFETAQKARKQTEIEADRETLQAGILGVIGTETLEIPNAQELEDNLPEGWTVDGTGPYTATSPNGNEFIVYKDGNILASASDTESYVGYYADIDGNGTVDGIIYADLAIGGSGAWSDNNMSNYSYEKVTEGLKTYYISNENGTGFGKWEKPVVTAKKGTTGNKDRFYVMAIKDFNSGIYYCWYDAAYGKLDNPAANKEFGEGKTNTTTMVDKWNSSEYGAQDDNGTYKDMWGTIQKEDKEGNKWDLNKWFVPSKAEWAAFGDMSYKEVGVTTGNYSTDYGLRNVYWSSTQFDANNAYFAGFHYGHMGRNRVDGNHYVRLSTTF